MSVFELSAGDVRSTARAVRIRRQFERPVALAAIHECLELALASPSGSLAHIGQFVPVDDADEHGRRPSCAGGPRSSASSRRGRSSTGTRTAPIWRRP